MVQLLLFGCIRQIRSFQPPSTVISVNPGSGLTWYLSNAAISVHGDWRYKAHIGRIPIRDHGNFDASASGISLTVSVTLGASPTGQPTINATNCSANVDRLKIKTHGGASWLYNLFMSKIERLIHGSLRNQICDAARKAINEDASRELATLKVKIAIKGQWLLDYSLVSGPLFAAGYLESFHKGEFFYATDPTEAPFQPAPLPSPPATDHMVTFWVSEYVVNTAGYVLHKHGAMKGIFTKNDLPPDEKDFLDTTCPHQCIGKIVPPIG